ncbi:MAG: matrixin family metalloprotease [Ferruginibacter sp.]
MYTEIKKYYSNISIAPPVELPAVAYYAPRKRYRADSIISILAKKAGTNQVILGLTAKDISTGNKQVKDWGVMGLGYCPGKACVASGFRLLKKDKKTQLFKVAIHELGHTQGLSHCSQKYCFMRDAEGGNPTNEEKAFCSSCKNLLKTRGWTFTE